ncbi:uncharacterized protein BDV17DRAFT_267954 [Aspergillus undulatus]|uniref:uncharacterized protein n=1 Tax=Aspergillus undulatus TaxID=1810928 RepID=UPI003CCDEA22
MKLSSMLTLGLFSISATAQIDDCQGGYGSIATVFLDGSPFRLCNCPPGNDPTPATIRVSQMNFRLIDTHLKPVVCDD